MDAEPGAEIPKKLGFYIKTSQQINDEWRYKGFPDLGRHCQYSDCDQLDFLPFTCDSCHKVYCLEHMSYNAHKCLKSNNRNREFVVCEIFSTKIEITWEYNEKEMLEKDEKSGDCDRKKKNKPTCPVRRCKEVLTFSNTSFSKNCNVKVCLKHRFPADHVSNDEGLPVLMSAKFRGEAKKILVAFSSRNAKDCAKINNRESTSPLSTPTIKAY